MKILRRRRILVFGTSDAVELVTDGGQSMVLTLQVIKLRQASNDEVHP